jgi:hypothetical protein
MTRPDPPIFAALMDDTDLHRQFEVAFILDELSPAERGTIAMEAFNEVAASLRDLERLPVPTGAALRTSTPATDSVTLRAHP